MAFDPFTTENDGTHTLHSAKITYDVSGGDSGTVASHGLGVTLPDNAIIFDGVLEIITTFVGATGTVAWGANTTTDLVAATAVASLTAGSLIALTPVGSAATAVKLTANREIQATVGTAAMTAGKAVLHLFYFIGD